MTTRNTLLCIHREPAQLSLLQESGYQLLTVANGSEGLRLIKSRPVDAIVLEYHLRLLDGTVVADEIKQVRPEIPIVMLTESLDLPNGALKSVDVLVTKSDGPHFLLAAVHFMLNVKPAQRRETPANLRRPGRSRAARVLATNLRPRLDARQTPTLLTDEFRAISSKPISRLE